MAEDSYFGVPLIVAREPEVIGPSPDWPEPMPTGMHRLVLAWPFKMQMAKGHFVSWCFQGEDRGTNGLLRTATCAMPYTRSPASLCPLQGGWPTRLDKFINLIRLASVKWSSEAPPMDWADLQDFVGVNIFAQVYHRSNVGFGMLSKALVKQDSIQLCPMADKLLPRRQEPKISSPSKTSLFPTCGKWPH